MIWAFLAMFALVVATAAIWRSWIVLVLPAVVVPAFYLGLRLGWWGHGVGDGWQFVALGVTVAALVLTATVVAVGRLLWPIERA
jgi:hypothetical protein